MKKVNINNKYILGINPDYNNIKTIANEHKNVIVVCFENNYSEEKYYIKLLNESWVKKVILIGAKPTSCFGDKLVVAKRLKEKFFDNGEKAAFIINTDIDEDVLCPIVDMFDICDRKGVRVGLDDVIGFSYDKTEDLIKSLQALSQENIYSKYEIVYDYICENLDKKFSDNSICQFEGDRCIANRKYDNRDKIMGCCYSFKYNGLSFSDVRLCEHQKDKKCDVKCLGCKLFTCDYLKKHGIKFSLDNMPIALAFFSKKQREILRTSFFIPKEDVLEKVVKFN